jgi:hypothetical protein
VYIKIHKTSIIVKKQWKIYNRPTVFILKGKDLACDEASSWYTHTYMTSREWASSVGAFTP